MPTPITPELLRPYFKGEKKHLAYTDTVKTYLDMKVHADGEYPREIIEARRPSEPDHIKNYRKTIFAEITMPVFGKVMNSLMKIRKSHDWLIKFDPSKVPARINEQDTLQAYTEVKFPVYKSVTKWAFDVLLRELEVDSGAVCLVMPDLTKSVPSNEYVNPMPVIFNSTRVLEFVEDDYCVLLSTDLCEYKQGDVVIRDGKVHYVATTQTIQRWEQTGSDSFAMTAEFKHNLGEMYAWKLGGQYWKSLDRTILCRPRVYPMIPFLREAVREYTDLQAGVVQHLYLERWEYEGPDCPSCNGTGKKKTKEGEIVACKAKGCSGGKVMGSPYQTIRMKRPGATDPVNVAPPPAGYIEKNPEIIEIQDRRIDKHTYKALAAVNMEFLAQTPLAESGESKKVDREEAHTFAHSVGEDLVYNIERVVHACCDQRYYLIVPAKDARKQMEPSINVPEKFDMFTSEYLVNEMKLAKDAGVNPVLTQAMEIEYAGKKFNADPSVKSNVELVLTLDPLPGITEDQKMSRLQNRGITEEDYVISSNISLFVREALFDNEDFGKLDYAKQMEVIRAKAQEKIAQNSKAQQVMSAMGEEDPENDNPDDTN